LLDGFAETGPKNEYKSGHRAPDPIDIYVGDRLRSRRKALDLSQQQLGTKVGVTFQQIQKYERGTNRIGASRLFKIANELDVEPQYFFDRVEQVLHPVSKSN